MTQTLREYATAQLEASSAEYGPPIDRPKAIERWMHSLVATGRVPDEILEALPEVSRHNDPLPSPQEWNCGCVAMVCITDRDRDYDEKPFELRLALPCDGTACSRAHVTEHCAYCAQELHVGRDGHFECGGDGEGICSFWGAIGDYQRAGRPAALESWLDAWIQEAVGEGWDEMGWDREAHAAAIRAQLEVKA